MILVLICGTELLEIDAKFSSLYYLPACLFFLFVCLFAALDRKSRSENALNMICDCKLPLHDYLRNFFFCVTTVPSFNVIILMIFFTVVS